MRFRLLGRVLCLLLLLFILILGTLYYQPDFLFALLAYHNPSIIWRVDVASERVVALSLDDAPSENTGEILELLGKYGAKATFFVLGKHLESHAADLKEWPEPASGESKELKTCLNGTKKDKDASLRSVVSRLRALGHEPAHHTWTDRRTLSIPELELDTEFDRLDEILYPCNDTKKEGEKWFRPGHGVYNAQLVSFAGKHGYRVVLGNIHPFDPQISSRFCNGYLTSICVFADDELVLQDAKLNAYHILSRARAGAIIILHDNRKWTVETLRIILPGLKGRGFEVVGVGEMWRRKKGG